MFSARRPVARMCIVVFGGRWGQATAALFQLVVDHFFERVLLRVLCERCRGRGHWVIVHVVLDPAYVC